MSAAALSDTPPAAETAPTSPTRSDLLLHEEITRIQTELAKLAPVAQQSLQRVLHSILDDRDLTPNTAAAAGQLQREIAARQRKQRAADEGPTGLARTSPYGLSDVRSTWLHCPTEREPAAERRYAEPRPPFPSRR